MKVLLLLLALQDPPAIDPAAVTGAVQRGVDWLKERGSVPYAAGNQLKSAPDPLGGGGGSDQRELVLFALWHAGVRETDPFFTSNFKTMLEEPPAFTYRVGVQAMLLEAMDPRKYQERLRECAQVLVDNQCANGQWDYGTRASADIATPGGKKPKVETPAAKGAPPPIRKQREGPPSGDYSNSQYAALGLRACRDAGIGLPPAVLKRAADAWKAGMAKGWCYNRGGSPPSWKLDSGSMTAGATGALIIYDHLLGKDWKKNEDVARGVKWLDDHWTVIANAYPLETNQTHTFPYFILYYLYGIERLGRLSGSDRVGAHDWYAEGAKAILDGQRPDGSWYWWHDLKPDLAAPLLADTCFAILFLTRGTKGLVPSVDLKKDQ